MDPEALRRKRIMSVIKEYIKHTVNFVLHSRRLQKISGWIALVVIFGYFVFFYMSTASAGLKGIEELRRQRALRSSRMPVQSAKPNPSLSQLPEDPASKYKIKELKPDFNPLYEDEEEDTGDEEDEEEEETSEGENNSTKDNSTWMYLPGGGKIRVPKNKVPAAVPNPKKSSEAAPKLPSAKKDEDDEFEWLLTPGGGRVKQRKEPSVKKNLVKRSSPNKDRTNSDLSGDGGDTGTSPTGEEPEPEDVVEEEVEDDPGPPLDAALLKIQKAYPWRNSSYPKRCQDLTVEFADINSLPVTALVSFPCSGNSLTRQLIEKASGIFTSSVYRDSSLEIGGFLGEKADAQLGVTILTKTHEFEQEHLDEFKKAVLLIRNPYRSILSFHHFLFKSHLGMAPSTNYFRDDWPTFCLSLAKRWAETIVAWVSSKPIHVVHYETLTDPKNQVDEIIKILKFLKFPVDESRLQCMKEDTNVIFKRKPGFYPDVDLFPRNVRATIDKAIVFVDKKLRQRKLPPMPLDKYEFFKDHPHTLKIERCKKDEEWLPCMERIDEMNS